MTLIDPSAPVGAASFSADGLTAPVTREDVRRLLAANPQLHVPARLLLVRWTANTVRLAGAAAALIAVWLPVLFMLLIAVAFAVDRRVGVPGLVCLIGAPAAVLLLWWTTRLIVDSTRRALLRRPDARRIVRLARFGQANGLVVLPREEPLWPGTLFVGGVDRTAYDVVTTPDRGFEIGNYRFGSHWTRDRAVLERGYVRIALSRRMPHIVLEARANRRSFGRSALPWQFRSSQHLALEGDFDRFFALKVPAGYERDALQVFTPDVMALLIDRSRTFDVEIVDDSLFLYSARPFDMLDAATYRRVTAATGALVPKLTRSLLRWRDERAELPGSVAPAGRRLRRRVPTGAIAVLSVWGLLALRAVVFGWH